MHPELVTSESHGGAVEKRIPVRMSQRVVKPCHAELPSTRRLNDEGKKVRFLKKTGEVID